MGSRLLAWWGIALLVALAAPLVVVGDGPPENGRGPGGPGPLQPWCSLYEGDGVSSPSTEGWTVRPFGNTIAGAVSDGATVAIVDDSALSNGAWVQRYMDFVPPFNISVRGRYDLATPRTGGVGLMYVFTGTHAITARITPTTITVGSVPVLVVPGTRGWYNITFEARAILDVDVYMNGVFAGNVEMVPSDSIIFDQVRNKPVIASIVTLIEETSVGMVDYIRTTMCPPTEVPAKVPDRTPPVTRDAVLADGFQAPAPVLTIAQGRVGTVWLNATVDDSGTGGSTIWSGNRTYGSLTWPGTPMTATDGAFDEVAEDVTGAINVTGLPLGTHRFCAYGRDYYGNRDLTGSCATLRIVDAPRVVAVLPLPDATRVPRTSSVAVAFSEPMSTVETEAAFSLTGPSGPVLGTVTWFAGNGTLAFSPVGFLEWGSVYTGFVAGSARDTEGTPLWPPYSWSFATELAPGDTVPPRVIATLPAPNARAVLVDTEVLVFFSEPMEPVATAAAFALTGPSGGVSGDVMWRDGGATLAFRPSTALLRDRSYTATVTNAARDVAGNALLLPVTWSFSTAPEPTTENVANWKPVIALVFAVVLQAAAILQARRMARQPAAPWAHPLIAAAVSSIAEVVTGAASMALPALAIPPWPGWGLVIDILVLAAGLAVVLLAGLEKGPDVPPSRWPPVSGRSAP